jgi:hypothetical protein
MPHRKEGWGKEHPFQPENEQKAISGPCRQAKGSQLNPASAGLRRIAGKGV